MKTLEQFNSDRAVRRQEFADAHPDPHPNGMACSKCGAELWDSCPAVTLTLGPPQKQTSCRECGWRGYRIG